MKKIVKIILWILLAVLLLIIGFAIYAITSILDNTDNTLEQVRSNDYKTMQIINREATLSLQNATEDEDIDFELSEYQLNEFCYAVLKEQNLGFLKFRGAFLQYNEDNLCIEIPVSVFGINSCVKGKIKTSYDGEKITLQIFEAKVGKLEITSPILRRFVFTESLKNSLQEELKKDGLDGEINFNDFTFSFSNDDIVKVFSMAFSKDDKKDLYSMLVDFCLKNQNIIEFHLGEDKEYGFTLHTTKLLYNEQTDGTISHPLNFSQAKEKTVQGFTGAVNYTNVSAVYSYYVNGYEKLSPEDKKEIDNLNYSKEEKGIKENTNITMLSVLLQQKPNNIITALTNGGLTFSINQSQMNSIFSNLDFIGMGSAFTDGTNLAYINIESMDLSIENQALQVSVIINLNGKRICIHANADCLDKEDSYLTAEIKQLRFGNQILEERYTSWFLSYMDTALKNENWISADKDAKTITLNIGKAVQESNEFSEVFTSNSIKKSMQCRKPIASEGEIQLIYKIGILQ